MSLCYILFAVLFAGADVLAAQAKEGIPSCEELFKIEVIKEDCCITSAVFADMMKKECFENKKDEWTCKDSECLLKNVTKNGKIDEKLVSYGLDIIDQQNGVAKPITAFIRKMCLDGGYENIPTGDDCSATKMMVCLYAGIVACPSWKDTDTCKKVAEHAKTCKNVLDTMKDE